MISTLNLARLYVQHGWSVIPIKSRSKEPKLLWKEFTERRATESELVEWFQNEPSNIGIVTGKISGLTVVDIDSYDGVLYARSAGIVSPAIVFTGKGRHLYFRCPDRPVGNSVKKLPGIDVRSDSGYVLAPPSIHSSGVSYRWSNGFMSVGKLPEFPISQFTSVTSSIIPSNTGWIGQALSELKEGNRDDTFTRIVGKLFRQGVVGPDILALLQPFSDRVGFPQTQLQKIITSISRYKRDDKLSINIHTFESSMDDYTNRYARREDTTHRTGYSRLDRFLGGLKESEIFTVGARTGTGKTNFLIQPAYEFCRKGKRVLFFSTEMSYYAVWERYLSVAKKYSGFEHHSLFVCDETTPSLAQVEQAINQTNPDLLIFDHINILGDEYLGISNFMKGLKSLVKVRNLCCIMAAQLNRTADWFDVKTHEKVIPRLSMIKGSGAIEEVSAQVLLLSETSRESNQNAITGYLAKNRYGEQGIIEFVLKKNPYCFEEA